MSYESEVLADAPWIFWEFDETSGTTATDLGIVGGDGTFLGAATVGAPPLRSAGQAAEFHGGSDECKAVGTSFGANTLTTGAGLELFVNLTTLPDSLVYLARLGTPTNSGISLFVDSAGHLTFNFVGAGPGFAGWGTGSFTVSTGTTYHVVGQYNANTSEAELWVNGVLISNVSASEAPFVPNTSTLSVGLAPNNDGVDVIIDEPALYYFSFLDGARIAAHYAARNPAAIGVTVYDVVGVKGRIFRVRNYAAQVLDDSPLIYYRLDETSGTTAADSSGNGNDGVYESTTAMILSPSIFLLQTTEPVYSDARDGTGSPTESGSNPSAGQDFDGTDYICYEGFASFDCSALTATPDEAVMDVEIFWGGFTLPSLANSFNVHFAVFPFTYDIVTGFADPSNWQTGADLSGLTSIGTIASSTGVTFHTISIDPLLLPMGGAFQIIFWSDRQEGAGNVPTGNEFAVVFPNDVRTATLNPSGWTLGATGLLVGDHDAAVSFPNDDTTNIQVHSVSWPTVDTTFSGFSLEVLGNISDLRHSWGYALLACISSRGFVDDIEIATESDGSSDDLGYYFSTTAGNVSAYAAFPNITTDVTYHSVLTWDGTAICFYVNGDLVDTQNLGGTLTIHAGNPLRGGCDGWGAGNGINGTVDEISLYDYALTADQVSAHYLASILGGPGPLTNDVGIEDSITVHAVTHGPTITSVSPVAGPGSGGTSVNIIGTFLDGTTTVKFGSTTASSFTVNSNTSVTAVSPSHPAGLIDITVVTAGGTSVTSVHDHYTFTPVPVISSISPNTGDDTGGTLVTIIGVGFTGLTTVRFGTTLAATFSIDSDTSMTATSPAHSDGAFDIRLTNPFGTSVPTGADLFTFTPPGGGGGGPPTRPPVVRWTFFDPADGSADTFEINPDTQELPVEKNIVTSNTLGPEEKTLVIAISDNAKQINFSGTIITNTMLDLLSVWFNKSGPIELTDDLSRSFTIRMIKFDAKRVRKTNNDWWHTYSATATIIEA